MLLENAEVALDNDVVVFFFLCGVEMSSNEEQRGCGWPRLSNARSHQ